MSASAPRRIAYETLRAVHESDAYANLLLPVSLARAGVSGASADRLAESTRLTAGTSIAQLRAQGAHSPLGEHTQAAVDALASGFADATRWSMLVAVAFLVLGLVGALLLRRSSRVG
ncbi:MAG: hypothetical protein J0H70_09505 [Microbacterium chocolatum]|nr:hypothetical protein [Microbacterium chocolatum]